MEIILCYNIYTVDRSWSHATGTSMLCARLVEAMGNFRSWSYLSKKNFANFNFCLFVRL